MIYLDNAATSYKKPDSVARALFSSTYKNSANAGRGGYDLSIESGEIIYETREKLADFFNIKNPERIALLKNTTEALNVGIKGVMLRGGHIITTSMEHNSVIRPIKSLQIEKGVSYSILKGNEKGELDLNKLERMIKKETRMIVMTHSSNVCGNIYDIKKAAEIAKRHNVIFMVDAAQSAGAVNIDATDIDLLAFPGHKGLLGPMGTGGLYVKEGINLKTIVEGGTGSLSESLKQPDFMPDMLESGTMNVPAIAGLSKALDFLKKTGTKTIYEYEESLLRRFEEGLKNMKGIELYGGNEKTAICAFNIIGRDCVEVAQILNDKYGICVRAGLHCAILAHNTLKTEKTGCIRASFGFFNTIKEVDYAIDAIYEILTDMSK